MKKPSEDPLEYVRQIIAEDPRTSVYRPKYCSYCNRICIPFRSKDNSLSGTFCHVCLELLYPRGFGFVGNQCGHHCIFPSKKTPILTKQIQWDEWVRVYETLLHHKFPYRRKFKYFEEPDSRMDEAVALYTKQRDALWEMEEKERVRTMQAECRFCGETFQRKTYNNAICPKCMWLLGRRAVCTISEKLKSGEYTKQKVKRLIKDKLERLDDNTKSLIANGEFNFADTPRTPDSIDKERAEILANLAKHRVVEKPVVRCVKCGQILTSQLDLERKSCQTCRDSMLPPDVRWFKGIVGLSNRSLEDIAKLPSYCHSAYTKHMTKKELAEFEMLLIPFRKEEVDRLMYQERTKLTHDDIEC